MKILIATFTYPPESNGVSHVAHAHAIGFVQRGHEVTVVTATNRNRNLEELKKERIKVFEFDVKGNGNIKVGYSGEIKKYQDFIAGSKADVMLFHCWQTWSTDLAIPVFSMNKAKKILVSHGVSANSILSLRNTVSWLCWRPYIWKMQEMIKTFDHIVFLSQRKDKDRFYDYHLVQKMGLSNYSIIPNGTYPLEHNKYLEHNEYKIAFKKKFIINTKYIILQVANYDFRKNQKMALEAFVESKVKDASLVFIGSQKNSYTNKLENYARQLNAQNTVLFLENLSRNEIMHAYVSADIFICSSLSEVQPLVILDAMNAGVPFISTDVGCVSDLPGGVIVKNTLQMAEQIKTLIEDEVLRKKLSEEGKKACSEYYSWSTIMDKYEELIKKLK